MVAADLEQGQDGDAPGVDVPGGSLEYLRKTGKHPDAVISVVENKESASIASTLCRILCFFALIPIFVIPVPTLDEFMQGLPIDVQWHVIRILVCRSQISVEKKMP